jgi:membrane-bound lytic murein transglycosylase B
MPNSSLPLLHQTLLATCATLLTLPLCHAQPKRTAAPEDPPDIVTYGQREDIVQFGAELAERQNLDPQWVAQQLAQSRYQPNVAKYIMPPPAGTAKNWASYRARFVEPVRLRAGVAFWRENEAWLAKAEEVYGVPAEVVVGIIGVETIYGQQMGNFRTIDALATLAFDFPKGRKDRSHFFRDELEQLFVLSQKSQRDPSTFKGSYAGAMGLGQFMPSSWNKYAVDFDEDGQIDMNTSHADVIGSVANYLAEFGWKRDMPARFDVNAPVDTTDRAKLLAPDITPTFTKEQFAEHGAALSASTANFEGLLALIELQNGKAAATYVAGTGNFYAVTRYNWSSYYAMAVLELGEEVGRVYRKTR